MLRHDPFITGEYYHLYNRGIDKRIIFKEKRDMERFMILLFTSNSANDKPLRLNNINRSYRSFEEIIILNNGGELLVSIGAWCLMGNHFHLLVRQEVDGGITKFMKKVGTGYSMYFNIKYERQGALFGGPFKSKCIKKDDNYMRQLFAYIHLNPLEIQFPKWDDFQRQPLQNLQEAMKKFLEYYRYSSYQDYIGMQRIEKSILHTEVFPEYFCSKKSFQEFIESYFTI